MHDQRPLTTSTDRRSTAHYHPNKVNNLHYKVHQEQNYFTYNFNHLHYNHYTQKMSL